MYKAIAGFLSRSSCWVQVARSLGLAVTSQPELACFGRFKVDVNIPTSEVAAWLLELNNNHSVAHAEETASKKKKAKLQHLAPTASGGSEVRPFHVPKQGQLQ